MKYTNLFYLAIFLILIIFVTSYFKSYYREGLVTIDPSIVNSNIPNGNGLSKEYVLSNLKNLADNISNTTITKINIVGNDNNYIVPPGTPNPGVVSLNGKRIGTIDEIIKQLTSNTLLSTSTVKSIDIQYKTK
jgi:hypothetical protein